MADPKFRCYVKIYAQVELLTFPSLAISVHITCTVNASVSSFEQDNEAFFRDYAESHKKLSELGFSSPAPRPFTVPDKKPATKENVNGLGRGAVGVAIAAAVVVFSYFFEIRRRPAK